MQSTLTVLEMVTNLSERAKEMGRIIPPSLESPELTAADAEMMLTACVIFLVSVDNLYSAIESAAENGTIEDGLEDSASDAADTLREFAANLQLAIFDRVRAMGQNAGAMLSEIQRRHYTD